MAEHRVTQDGLERIEAAQRKYAAALRQLYDVRHLSAHAEPADSESWLDEANRLVKEAFAEWVMLFEHETGHKFTSITHPIPAE